MASRKRYYRKKQGKKILSAVAVILIIAVLAVLYYIGALDGLLDKFTDNGSPRVPNAVSGEMQIHFIDIGQGDAILLVSEGKYMLVDTGDKDDEYNEKLVNYLQGYGVETINYLVLTHPDADHIGGAPDVINTFNVEKCIMPDYVKTTRIFEDTVSALEDNNVEVINANEALETKVGNKFSVGEAQCEILAPLKTDYDDVNDASVVIFVSFGETTVLLTGDAEAESEEDMVKKYSSAALKADVLKSGHHGSRTSSGDAFLDKVNPKYAVISCGEGNKYSHPHTETLNKYEERGIEVYRTDIAGTIVMSSDGENIAFALEK